MRRHFRMTITAVVAVCMVAACFGPAMAQTGGGKDTKKLRDKVEAARNAVENAKGQIQETMELYNSLVEEKAKKPDATFKKLTKGVDSSDNAAKSAGKAVQSMQKDLEKFFSAWGKELDSYSSESVKAAAQKSYDETKGKLDRFGASLKEASEIYDPFITNLRDQVAFMGRDLSPEAMSALKDPAEDLNGQAKSLFDKIDEALNDSQSAAADADAAETAHDDAAEEAEGADTEKEGDSGS